MKPLAILFILLLVNSSLGQDASLKMRFVYKGDPPKQKTIDPRAFAFPNRHPIMDEKLLVDPESRSIQNVAMFVDPKSQIPSPQHVPKRHTLTMENARFSPRFIVARAGDTLEIVNNGPVVHNASPQFLRNTPFGHLVRAGQPRTIPLKLSEPTAMPINCDIHPWMRAFVIVMDHPFAAVSDSKGNMTIEGLPAGSSLEFKLFHEAAKSIGHVYVDGERTNLSRSKLKLTLKPGENDLGDILVPAIAFFPDLREN